MLCRRIIRIRRAARRAEFVERSTGVPHASHGLSGWRDDFGVDDRMIGQRFG